MTNKERVEERKIKLEDYIVHINILTDSWLKFSVYPAYIDEKIVHYIDKENEPEIREIFEEEKCLKKLEGSFCWRGVWEGRLYFTDEEYWGEEIEELSRIYNDHIVPWCKEYIIDKDPHNYYD